MEEIQRLMEIARQVEIKKERARERARLHYERHKNDPTFKEMRRLKSKIYYHEQKAAQMQNIVLNNNNDDGTNSGTEEENV